LYLERRHTNNPPAFFKNLAGLKGEQVVLFRSAGVGREQDVNAVFTPSAVPWFERFEPFVFNCAMARNHLQFFRIDARLNGNVVEALRHHDDFVG